MGGDIINQGAIEIYSIEANSLYAVNNKVENSFLDLGKAVINESLFSKYARKHNVTVNKRGKSYDFIMMKFTYKFKGNKNLKEMKSGELREYYYNNGADVTWETRDDKQNIISSFTNHYRMLMRSTGKAKDGDCIFVRDNENDNIYEQIHNYLTMGLYDKMPDKRAKIVEMSAYSTLTTATAIGYITIPMKNILIIEDEKSSTSVNAVTVKCKKVEHTKKVIDFDETEKLINNNGYTFYKKKVKENPNLQYIKKNDDLREYGLECILKDNNTTECYVDRGDKKKELTNVLWDGMGVIDESIFPKGKEGFIYCRNHFFKSCLFRGNIQEYFKDYYKDKYESAMVADMFGNKLKVSDIKVIITNNSIKWLKFWNLMGETKLKAYKTYCKTIAKYKNEFAIVKTAHNSKWGEVQRGSYQIYNSLPCRNADANSKELQNIARLSVDYVNNLKTSHESFIQHLKLDSSKKYSINNVLIALDEHNEYFKYTNFFKTKKAKIINDFKDNRLKQGKLLQYGDNLTICGNVIALLMKVTGEDCNNELCFTQECDGIRCYSTMFQDGEEIAGFRSPHNSPNNIVYLVNTLDDTITKYFPKLGKNVIIINGIKTDVQSRLNGQDLDTDGIFATNQKDIVEMAKIAYKKYPTIINEIKILDGSKYDKDMKSYAKMDNQISSSQNAIGYSSNVAQIALSKYFDEGANNRELEDIFIIASVLAQVAIDSSKRTFELTDLNLELRRLANLECTKKGKKYPKFYADIQKYKNKHKRVKKKINDSDIGLYKCPMDALVQIIDNGIINLNENKELNTSIIADKDSRVFKYTYDKKKDTKQIEKIKSIILEYSKNVDELKESDNKYSDKRTREFESLMRKIEKLSINNSSMKWMINEVLSGNSKLKSRTLVTLYDYSCRKNSKENGDYYAKSFLSCFEKTPEIPTKSA